MPDVATATGHRTESIYGRYNIVDEKEQEEGLAKVKLPPGLMTQPS